MDTIIVKPRSNNEYKEVVTFLRKMKIKTEIYKERSKREILKSIENGAKEAALFVKGKIQLQNAKSLLSEL
ncbi:MAG: hypothetical protein H0W75_00725 [Chitinophagaceae bacterium]|nr:hypothetical protein [Chitinophagaceae bacterium]